MSPVRGRPPRAPHSRPVKPGAKAPGVGKGTMASRKLTGAPRATGPDEARLRFGIGFMQKKPIVFIFFIKITNYSDYMT